MFDDVCDVLIYSPFILPAAPRIFWGLPSTPKLFNETPFSLLLRAAAPTTPPLVPYRFRADDHAPRPERFTNADMYELMT